LEEVQQKLEEYKRELVLKDREIGKYQSQMASLKLKTGEGSSAVRQFGKAWYIDERLNLLKSQVRRLEDYMVRAQQLITLLICQGGKSNQVNAAMKRINWDYMCSSFPQLIQDLVDGLQSLQTQICDGRLPLSPEQKGSSQAQLNWGDLDQ